MLVDRRELYKGKPVKALTEGKSSSGGRNNLGRITVRFRGGGHKRVLRNVDFKRREQLGVAATVERIEYDPNRTGVHRADQLPRREAELHPGPQRLQPGDKVVAGESVDIKRAMPLRSARCRWARSSTMSS